MIDASKYETHDSLLHNGINHGFFTRHGGVSKGLYEGLNCGAGSNDHPSHIAENRNRVGATLGVKPDHLLSLYQIHSAEVHIIDSKPDLNLWNSFDRPQADGFATKRDDIAIGILTADCGPILFADPGARVIGAAHAGWKGAFSGVMGNTVDAMVKLGADRSNINAVLGPCIHQTSYEVGQDFKENFIQTHQDNEKYFVPSTRNHHAMFDLPAFIMDKLNMLELNSCGFINLDTRSNLDQFYSYRRTTLAQEPDYGRQISAISLQKGY